ncbi:Polyprenol reductase [Amphibalanus amphitrite]|uniref:Polyprenal reductase n=1 Tax=Amphibalanus amphitrite TaxID=1232801 RepID=A0A6A4WDL9_AMPAM|nr:Polyprenol reductase [Amphibalanus amphitrite]
MMYLNLIFWYFLSLAIVVTIVGFVVNSGNAPGLFVRLFMYGKTSVERTAGLIQVPKRWFLHFYLVGSMEVTFVMAQVIQVNVVGRAAPAWLRHLLATLTDCHAPSCSPESVVLATCLLTAQIYRRLYEHLFVHVPSDTRMNVLHYWVGVLHYVLGVIAVVAEAPGFVLDDSSRWLFNVTKLSWLDRICGAVFMLAWLHQYRANCIFADLRKNSSGKAGAAAVVNRGHAVPKGDWFEYVSCPHYLAEVVMYSCLTVILGPRHLHLAGCVAVGRRQSVSGYFGGSFCLA